MLWLSRGYKSATEGGRGKKISFQEKEEKYPTVRKAEHIKMENINIYTLFWRIK